MVRLLLTLTLLSLSVQPALSICKARLEGDLRISDGDYDPFDALDFRRTHRITIRNIGDSRCDFIVGFRRQPPSGYLAWFLRYRIEDASGQALLTEQVPSTTGASHLIFASVPPSQTASADYSLVMSRGQLAFPGTYQDDRVTLSLHVRDSQGRIGAEEQDTEPLQITQTVKASVGISVAGGGLTTTLNFGDLATGQERSVMLQARANHAYSLLLRSQNGGAMKLDPEIPGQSWTIPYSLRVNSAAVSLLPSSTIHRSFPRHSDGAESHMLAFRIEDMPDRRAGFYRDVITVEISVDP